MSRRVSINRWILHTRHILLLLMTGVIGQRNIRRHMTRLYGICLTSRQVLGGDIQKKEQCPRSLLFSDQSNSQTGPVIVPLEPKGLFGCADETLHKLWVAVWREPSLRHCAKSEYTRWAHTTCTKMESCNNESVLSNYVHSMGHYFDAPAVNMNQVTTFDSCGLFILRRWRGERAMYIISLYEHP
ncbi:hypothetical protein BT63DRAFT_209309 [Microthyrium microscopicum]|uniref:Uncharacterized protein n=1 Tax=Microthyrium microscopicum TaxID=703497 RepID=A0A6A6UHU7_9PEZI|nr:hypothetical protein BT63DRAFT_209309 [Microthyrium microscopicum]